jgi:hypothetical protein
MRGKATIILAVIGSLLLLTACDETEQSVSTQPPTTVPTATLPPTPSLTKPAPTATPMPPTPTPSPAATDTPTPLPTDTPAPTATFTPIPPTVVLPTATPVPSTQVTDARVIYHDASCVGGICRYPKGAFPWMDLLVRLGDTWCGPEREPNDDIDAQPLPETYHWEASGGFGTLPNGEAWWAKPSTEGTARLIGPNGELLVELPLRIAFRGSGEDKDSDGEEKPPEPKPQPPPGGG